MHKAHLIVNVKTLMIYSVVTENLSNWPNHFYPNSYFIYPKQYFIPSNWSCDITYNYGYFFVSILFFFFSFIFISWRLITVQHCSGFCHTLK